MTLKEKIHQRYSQLVADRIDAFRDMISALTQDAQNDAKSSAGDKHETALSMMHLEQEKLNAKLAECYAQKAVLDKIDVRVPHRQVALGSVVVANGVHFFVSAALPKVSVDGTSVLALSCQSPLGSRLMGKSAGESVELNTTVYVIGSVE